MSNFTYFARGSFSSGSRSYSSARTSSTSTRSTSTTSRTSTTSKTSTPKTTTKTSTKPGTSFKTSSGKTVKSSTVRPSNKAYSNERGIVGANGYTPRFYNGYNAPAGSVVYYHDTSFVDYLPWIYLFSHNDPATPANQTATVVQPDGKQIQAKPVAQGTDGLAVLNWFLLVIIAVVILGGIVWGVNKLTSK